MKIQVLDHGYVELIECWGVGKDGRDLFVTQEHGEPVINDDCDFKVGIIEAARQSTQGSFRGWGQGDSKLLTHLYTNGHSTPFEFAGMVIEVQAPIMVFREWHRHRTQSYNEASARYAPLPDLYYEPSQEHVWSRAISAKIDKNAQAQAAGKQTEALNEDAIKAWVAADYNLSRILEQHYQQGLAIGIPKELARKKMPVDHYSKMRASALLTNWLRFMTLRCDLNAQWEIRQFADAVAQLVAARFPQTYQLWKAEQ